MFLECYTGPYTPGVLKWIQKKSCQLCRGELRKKLRSLFKAKVGSLVAHYCLTPNIFRYSTESFLSCKRRKWGKFQLMELERVTQGNGRTPQRRPDAMLRMAPSNMAKRECLEFSLVATFEQVQHAPGLEAQAFGVEVWVAWAFRLSATEGSAGRVPACAGSFRNCPQHTPVYGPQSRALTVAAPASAPESVPAPVPAPLPAPRARTAHMRHGMHRAATS
ncbi:hypothetical protein H4582DRAFT_1941715 [Lactarius indigo]|nr:hypothetical protein H4582DRAFT_1941715 [Lactarius indigo]